MDTKALKKISNEILPEIKTNMSSADMMDMVLKLDSYEMTDSSGLAVRCGKLEQWRLVRTSGDSQQQCDQAARAVLRSGRVYSDAGCTEYQQEDLSQDRVCIKYKEGKL